MCDPIEAVSDVVATATGNPELIPLINAGESTGEGLVKGEGLGKSLVQGAESGGIALAGQEAAGSIGIGGGNSFVNDALGVDSGLGLGLPDVGGGINDALNSAGDSISNAYGDVKDSLGLSPSTTASSSSITDLSNGAGGTAATGGTTSATGGTGAPGISASAAPEVAQQQISTQLGSNATGAIGGDTGFGSVAPGAGPFDVAANNFGKTLDPSLSGITPASTSAASGAAGASGSSLSKLAPLVPLGNLAYQAISGPGKLPSSAASLAAGGAATKPLLDTETAQLGEANSGQLTAPQQANIQQYVSQAQNQLIQQLANSGVTNFKNDSRYLEGMKQIQAQALAQQQQYIQNAVSNGVAAGGAASGNIAGVANEQISQDKEFQDALAAAFGSFGSLVGGQPNIRIG